ncbi:MAG: tRNA (adenosine(37)-N6)-threonylcarbamoyltransferase complex transferase subunit TsaD [Firmicutes bacterium]|nr:tRNA (adenosine(37)-N6)-threonylcarbamoyltransferase complex transferase subunit TsaD [Bacillota bacterium]
MGSRKTGAPGEPFLVLGIETSCDETAASVVSSGRRVLSNVVASQVEWHREFGGVVPEIASRKHLELIVPVMAEAVAGAGIDLGDLGLVAVTRGPGLAGSLFVGLSAAKAVSLARGVPLSGVNHIEAHLYANFLDHPSLEPPLVCLTVSGGHTDLIHMKAHGELLLMGRTRDDAAGEALDKVARFLGLGYPGGPVIDRLALSGDPESIRFPRAMLRPAHGYDFSFSGLKTAAVNHIRSEREAGKDIPLSNFAASFQEAIVDVLVSKAVQAAQDSRVELVVLSGGVAANSRLRLRMSQECERHSLGFTCPAPVYCTDNAAMVAGAGYFRFMRGERDDLSLGAAADLQLVNAPTRSFV